MEPDSTTHVRDVVGWGDVASLHAARAAGTVHVSTGLDRGAEAAFLRACEGLWSSGHRSFRVGVRGGRFV